MGIINKSSSVQSNTINSKNYLVSQQLKNEYISLINNKKTLLYQNNKDNRNNIIISLVWKSFTHKPEINRAFTTIKKIGYHHNKKKLIWDDYMCRYLFKEIAKNHRWANILLTKIQKESFYNTNEFLSLFFHYELEFYTKPKCLREDTSNFSAKTHNKMDIDTLTDTFGGSFVSSYTDSNLLPNDPSIEYKALRNKIKSYVKIFKEHIFNTRHPINIIVTLFSKQISVEIKNKLTEMKLSILSSINNNNTTTIIEESKGDNLTNRYVTMIQKFILKTQAALKLFYAYTINYDCLREEKDEFVNLICCLLFQVNEGLLYKTLYELYQISLSDKISVFQEKLGNMQEITLKDLGIKEQFRLDDSTFKLMKMLIKEKTMNIPNNNSNYSNNNNELHILKAIEQKIIANQQEEKLSISEDNEEYQNLKYIKSDSKSCSSQFNESFHNETLFRVHLDSLNEEHDMDVQSNNISITITPLKAKKKQCLIKLNNGNHNKSDQSYNSAIELFKSITNYEVPFQKMLIFANLSLEISKCINDFWEDLHSVLSNDILNIDADELMSIFIYIIIKANINDIFIHQQFIADFTTPITKSTMIGYYYSTVEASLIYLSNTTNRQNLCDKRKRSSMVPDRNSFNNEY